MCAELKDSQPERADLHGVAIIVVNYGSSELLRQNLVPVAREAAGADIVVVDNFTSSAEQRAVLELCGQQGWRPVLLLTNTGFGEGVNAGARTALDDGADVLIVLNPDASICRPAIERLVGLVRDDPFVVAAPTIWRTDGRRWFSGSDLLLEDGRMSSPARRAAHPDRRFRAWLTGACFAISGELWQVLDGFDPDYFLYWEDVDLSWRVLEVGGQLVVDAEADAVHDAGGTHTQRLTGRAKSELYYYYNIRNRLMFAAKHIDVEDLRSWLSVTRRVSYEILLQGGRAQFVRPWRPIRAYLRGIRDGRRFLNDRRDVR